MDPKEIRRRVARHLGRKEIPDPIWRWIEEQGYLEELLSGGGGFKNNLRDLRNAVRRLLTVVRQVNDHRPPWALSHPTVDSAFTEYVELMTRALHEPETTSWGTVYPNAIRGGFRSGRIHVEAEPWVPAASVERYYRELQLLVLGEHRNESVQVRSLERYLWVRERRRSTDESWAQTKDAWEGTGGRLYPSVKPFTRDFRRTARFLERVRSFHREALRQEAELG
jgi:hypothetical protein